MSVNCTNAVFKTFLVLVAAALHTTVTADGTEGFRANYDLSILLSETLTPEDMQKLSTSSPYLYQIEGRGALSLVVGSREIVASGTLPVQIARPRRLGESPRIARTQYLMYYSRDGFMMIGEGRLESVDNWNVISRTGVIPINSVLIWKNSSETVFLANPTRYLASQWQPEPGVILLLAGVDPAKLGLQRSSGEKLVYELETGGIRVKAKYKMQKSGKSPILIEVSRGKETSAYRILATRNFGRDTVPSVVEFSLKSNNKNHKVRFSLLTVDTNSSPPSQHLTIPAGTTVDDFRHISETATPDLLTEERAVKYIWRGRIPTEAEIIELAGRQGRILPPDTPSRRYSPFLFAPAVIFFALAAYFYFRNRRR